MLGQKPRWVVLLFVAIFSIGGLVFGGQGLNGVLRQHARIARSRPVPATVLGREIRSRLTGSGKNRHRSYLTVIQFEYNLAGTMDTASAATAAGEWGSYSVAANLNNRTFVGKAITAWYDPATSDAFAFRDYGANPYGLLGMGFLFVLGAGILISLPSNTPLPRPQPGGKWALSSNMTTARRARTALATALIGQAGTAASYGHFFLVSSPPYDFDSVGWAYMSEVVVLAALGTYAYYAMLGRHVHDARVLLAAPTATFGTPIQAQVSQVIRSDLKVQEVVVSLVRVATRGKGRRERAIDVTIARETVQEARAAYAGETLRYDVTLPLNDPGQVEEGFTLAPGTWKIEVRTRIAHAPDYVSPFPLQVLGDPAESAPSAG